MQFRLTLCFRELRKMSRGNKWNKILLMLIILF